MRGSISSTSKKRVQTKSILLEIQLRLGLTFNFSGGAKQVVLCRQPPPVDEDEEEEMLKIAIAMSMEEEEKEEQLFSIRHQGVGEFLQRVGCQSKLHSWLLN